MISAVELDRADHDDPLGIRRSDHSQGVAGQGVPDRTGDVAVRLVEEFEPQVRRPVLVVSRDLLPEREEPGCLRTGIVHDRIVVVHVHNDDRTTRQQGVNDGVDPGEEGAVDGERGRCGGMPGPLHR